MLRPGTPLFFPTQSEWRKWLTRHHARAPELWVGFHKRHTGKPTITWPQSVDEALCFGWIDGIRKSLGAESYVIRFTPRREGSAWSNINVRRVGELIEAGRMRPPGLKAFEARKSEKSGVYSYEQRKTAALRGLRLARFKANRKAWEFYRRQAPWYRRTVSFWILSARKEETRERRLQTLIASSAQGRRLGLLERPARAASG